MEDIKVSKEYKKAYNQADLICTYMPHLLDKIETPKNEPSAYKQGFEDRIKQYEIERDAIRHFSVERLREKYGFSKEANNKDRSKDIGKD